MRVNDPDKFRAPIFRVSVGPQVHLGVDCVDTTRCRVVWARIPSVDHARVAPRRGLATKQTASLVGKAIDEVRKKVVE